MHRFLLYMLNINLRRIIVKAFIICNTPVFKFSLCLVKLCR
jgi:hypothetical protein